MEKDGPTSAMRRGLSSGGVVVVLRRRWPAGRRGKVVVGGKKSELASSKRRPSLPPTPAESFTDEEAGSSVVVDEDSSSSHIQPQPRSHCSRSLGVGTLHRTGSVLKFEPAPDERRSSGGDMMTAAPSTRSISGALEGEQSSAVSSSPPPAPSNRHYLRVSDLRKLDLSLQSSMHGSANETESSDGDEVVADVSLGQCWLWLGCATNSPVAVNALAEIGWNVATNPKLWSLASGSISSQPGRALHDATFQPAKCSIPAPPAEDGGGGGGHPVLVWTGKLHGLHRSDLPAVRAASVLNVSPSRLAELLIDSGRVKEYNPHSQGRVDLHVLQASLLDSEGRFGGVTKVVRSSSKPPLLRKPLEFTSLFHARAVMNGKGYLIVTRSVSNDRDCASSSSLSSLSEILLSVNLLLPVGEGGPRTLMITVNHIYSPLIPTLLAKRIGVQAAASYLADLKQCIVTA